MKSKQTWIIDGHNVIFAIGRLEQLQASGKRREAREALVHVCRRFAASRQERVMVIFDGVPGFTEGVEESSLLEVAFAPYEGKADDLIVLRADSLTQHGQRTTVVTDDQDLKRRLHRNVTVIGTRSFWQLKQPARKPTGEETPKIPLKDVEEFFLSNEEAVMEELDSAAAPRITVPRDRTSSRHSSTRPSDAASPGHIKPAAPERDEENKAAGRTRPTSAPDRAKDEAASIIRKEQLRLKKERGRRKHLKRLARARKKKH